MAHDSTTGETAPRDNDIRPGEVAVVPPPATDAGLVFIGRIHTPWRTRRETPHRGSLDGPLCRIEVFEPWVQALDGLDRHPRIEVLYWLHLSRRDLVRQSRAREGIPRGTFSLRSPVRPIRSARRSSTWSASRVPPFWCAAWTAWTGHRCWT